VNTSGLGRFSLGQPVPARPHAVCVSLPKVSDLIGYEEKDPATLAAMPTGYPRFVRHQMIDQMIGHLLKKGTGTTQGYLFSKLQDCQDVVQRYSVTRYEITEEKEFTLLKVSKNCPSISGIASHFQHTGCGISSRLAEKYLWEHGLIEQYEILHENNQAEAHIRQIIAQAHGSTVREKDVALASSGANAFHALFGTAVEHTRKQGKTIWIRWGWLYLDTIEVMSLYTGEDGQVIEVNQVADLASLKKIFDQQGDKIAGVVTEFPTNPLLQAGDLEQVRSWCDQSGALLFIDPTMVSPKNAQITHLADVVINSLTKYAGWEGDVMMGSLVFPSCSPAGKNLFVETCDRICPPYERDLYRMAEQIPFYDDFISRANANAMMVAHFLTSHPRIKKLHWAYQPGLGKNYEKFAGPDRPGCNLSFECSSDFAQFYDRLQMLKSPSFGTEFSNCCPYVYLAHYPLIKSQTGLYRLAGAGIPPHLLRLSVGLEPVEQITDALDFALK